jgi:hypothetical protein
MVNPISKCNHAMLSMSANGETIVKWKTFSKHWCCYNEFNTGNTLQKCNLNQVFTNGSKEEEIFPLTAPENGGGQKADNKFNHSFKRNTVLDKGLEARLFYHTYVVCKDGRMIIPKALQQCTVLWFHHHLQHPGHI